MDLSRLSDEELTAEIDRLEEELSKYDTDEGMMLDGEGGTDAYNGAQEEIRRALAEEERRNAVKIPEEYKIIGGIGRMM